MSDLLCPWCGGELPGKPGQFVKCRHCASDIYWGDNKPWRTRMQAANASEQSKPSQPVPVDENTFVAVPSCKPDFVSEDVLPAPVPLVKPPPAPKVKPRPAPMVVPAPVQLVEVGWFEAIRQKKEKRVAKALERLSRAEEENEKYSNFDLLIVFTSSFLDGLYSVLSWLLFALVFFFAVLFYGRLTEYFYP